VSSGDHVQISRSPLLSRSGVIQSIAIRSALASQWVTPVGLGKGTVLEMLFTFDVLVNRVAVPKQFVLIGRKPL
jgi:hypothetical protein